MSGVCDRFCQYLTGQKPSAFHRECIILSALHVVPRGNNIVAITSNVCKVADHIHELLARVFICKHLYQSEEYDDTVGWFDHVSR